jgi:tetratricopeptide (TPR) repeat protein
VRSSSKWTVWLGRLILFFGAPFLFLLIVEIVLRLAGFGYPTSFFLPAKIEGKNVMVQNDRFTWRFLGRAMGRKPFPAIISRQKAPDTIRIFVMGESAAYGDPQPEFGLARMLEALLQLRYPDKQFEVVNVAMTAINSHVILPVAHDCASEDGDVWVVYMGNNEVVGPFGAGTVFGSQKASLAVIRLSLGFKTFRFGQLFDALVSKLTKRSAPEREWGGMAMFMQNQVPEDDPRMKGVYAHFDRNLRDLLSIGRRRGVKIVVGTVASNLKDCAPFGSQHRSGITDAELTLWNKSYQEGLAAQEHARFEEAVALFRKASETDDSFADLQFAWGHCCLAQEQETEAVQHLTKARDEDTLRFRADSRINEIIRNAAADREGEGIGIVDSVQALSSHSTNHLVGNDYLYEHVHLNSEGNYLLALAFAQEAEALLPSLAGRATNHWASPVDCAKRLAWTDWNRYQAESAIFRRITEAPFTGQMNHRQQIEKRRLSLDRLRAATVPANLHLAAQECRSTAKAFPEDWILQKELAELYEQLGDYGGAAEAWRNVVKSMPHCGEFWQALGRAFAAQKQDQQAQEAFAKALQLEPGSPEALMGLAEIFSMENRQEQAMATYETILKLKPYWGPAHWGLAKSLEALGRSEEAQPHFRLALQNRIYTPTALKGLAKLCFDKGWLNEAVTNFSDALKLEPFDAAAEVNLGLTLSMLGRNPEAERHFAEALRLDPNLAEAHVRLGFEMGRQGQDAAALEHFAKAVQLRPEMLEARVDLGIALVNQHREAEALEQFQEVLKRNPTNAIALKYVARLNRKK